MRKALATPRQSALQMKKNIHASPFHLSGRCLESRRAKRPNFHSLRAYDQKNLCITLVLQLFQLLHDVSDGHIIFIENLEAEKY